MKSNLQMVEEFHRSFDQPVEPRPTPATPELRELRVRLIAEELGELCEALGVELELRAGGPEGRVLKTHCDGARPVDLIETADALGDLEYVIHGSSLTLGTPAQPVFEEIHRSNMSKLGPDGRPIKRSDGKILKGPAYRPPELVSILVRASD